MSNAPIPVLAEPPEEPRRVYPTLITYLLLCLLVLVPLGILLGRYVVSVLIGTIIAVLCYPLYARLRRRLPGWASGLVVTLGVVLLGLIPVTLLAVGAFRQGAVLVEQLSIGDTPTISEVVERVRGWLPFTDSLGSPAEIRAILQEGLTRISQTASAFLIGEVQALPERVLQGVLVVLSTYFMLVDGRRLFNWVAGKVPLSRHIRELLVISFQTATRAVVMASIAAAAAQALLLLLGFWVLGVPAALLAGGVAFVLAWIPTVGPMPVWIAASIYLYYHQHSPAKAAIMVGIGLVVGIVDNVVRPLVLRGQQEMHPMVSLLAILGGLVFMGLPGAFIGPLVAAMAIAVLDIWPAVASYCGIPVSGAGEDVPDVPMIASNLGSKKEETPP